MVVLMTLLNRKRSLAELSTATVVNNQTLKTWFAKDYPAGNLAGAVTGGGGPGQRRAFSFNTVMEIAIVAKLQEIGHGTRDLAALFKSAQNFAHVGSAGKDYDLPDRHPGLPFHHSYGDTIFAASPVRTFAELYSPERDTYRLLKDGTGSDHFVTINATMLFADVCIRLGTDFRIELDLAYPEELTE